MNAVLNPCHCGYTGALAGMQQQGVFLSVSCPECRRTVEAFTTEGLVTAWNKPAKRALSTWERVDEAHAGQPAPQCM